MTDLSAELDPIITACLDAGLPLARAIHAIDARFVQVAIARAGGNMTKAALSLGVHRNSLYHRMRPQSRQDKQLRTELRDAQKRAAELAKEIGRRNARRKV